MHCFHLYGALLGCYHQNNMSWHKSCQKMIKVFLFYVVYCFLNFSIFFVEILAWSLSAKVALLWFWRNLVIFIDSVLRNYLWFLKINIVEQQFWWKTSDEIVIWGALSLRSSDLLRSVIHWYWWSADLRCWIKTCASNIFHDLVYFTFWSKATREALKNWYFLGIIRKLLDPPHSSIHLGIKMSLLSKTSQVFKANNNGHQNFT